MKKLMLMTFMLISLVSCSTKSVESINKNNQGIKPEESTSAYDKAKEESSKLTKKEEVRSGAEQGVNKAINNKIAKEKLKYTICIDPGHQREQIISKEPIAPGSSTKKPGVSSGAIGVSTKKEEYELNLEVSMIIRKKLEAKGYNVVMTRTTNDVSLSNINRAEIGNSCNASLVVRVHADSNESSSVNGYSILYPSGEYTKGIQAESKKASEFIDNKIKEYTGSLSRGIVPRDDMTGLNWSKVPSVVVEMGFLSNPNEDRLMSDKNYQDKMASGIVTGVEEYLKSK